jgi:hypothetical protein
VPGDSEDEHGDDGGANETSSDLHSAELYTARGRSDGTGSREGVPYNRGVPQALARSLADGALAP